MQVERYAQVDDFLAMAGDFLAAREAEHNLMLGLAGRLRSYPRTYGDDPYFAVAATEGRVVGASLRTPPHNVVLSEMHDERAPDVLCADAYRTFETVPGVVGPKDAAASFARTWEELTGARPHLALAQRVYSAESVVPAPSVNGRMRPYEDADRELVLRWLDAFFAEAMPHGSPENASGILDRRLKEVDGGLVVWEDGEPVSLGGFGGPTPNGIRIGPIYTPPDRRRRGYASALVAELTAKLLGSGRRYCFLYTDLANPTSNAIYQRVGYRPVTDADEWRFDP